MEFNETMGGKICSGLDFLDQKILTLSYLDLDNKHHSDYDFPHFAECSSYKHNLAIKRMLGFLSLLLFLLFILYHYFKDRGFLKKWVRESIFFILDEENAHPQPIRRIRRGSSHGSRSLFEEEKKEVEEEKKDADEEKKDADEEKKEAEEEKMIPVKDAASFPDRPPIENSNVYIFDCDRYCCQCCPSEYHTCFYTPITSCLSRSVSQLKALLPNIRLSIFAYVCVVFSFMLFRPLELLFSLILANECVADLTGLQVVFFFWDLLTAFVYTFTIYFLVTFIVLRRELQRIDPRDVRSRYEMLMFTFKKGWGFGFMIMMIKVLFMLASGKAVSEIAGEQSAIVAVYSIVRELLFLSVLMKGFLRKRNAIKTDCDVVKEEAKIYMMLSFIYKKWLGKSTVMKYYREEFAKKKKIESNLEDLKEHLKNIRKQKIEEIEKGLNIIDAQNFKNVLLKSSKYSRYPKLAIGIMSINFLMVLTTDCLYLGSYMITVNDDSPCNYYGAIVIMKWLAKIIEFFVVPPILWFTVKKNTFFGQEEEVSEEWENE